MKRIIISVSCVNNEADEVPESFAADINDSLRRRIIELSEAVKSSNAYSINEFEYSGSFSNLYLENSDESDPAETYKAITESEERMECNLLNVTATDFFWEAIPKHCGDDLAVSTRRIPLSFLQSEDQNYIDL